MDPHKQIFETGFLEDVFCRSKFMQQSNTIPSIESIRFSGVKQTGIHIGEVTVFLVLSVETADVSESLPLTLAD